MSKNLKKKENIVISSDSSSEKSLSSQEFIVEKILQKKVKRGRWQDFNAKDNTWEPRKNVENTLAFEKFEKDELNKAKRSNSEKNKRKADVLDSSESDEIVERKEKKRILNEKSSESEEEYIEENEDEEEDEGEEYEEEEEEEEIAISKNKVAANKSIKNLIFLMFIEKNILKNLRKKPNLRTKEIEIIDSNVGKKIFKKKSGKIIQKKKHFLKGNFATDLPKNIIDWKKSRKNYEITVEWKKRANGIKPVNSILSSTEIRKKDPEFLLDFYEKYILFK